jgi:hypothetical protein
MTKYQEVIYINPKSCRGCPCMYRQGPRGCLCGHQGYRVCLVYPTAQRLSMYTQGPRGCWDQDNGSSPSPTSAPSPSCSLHGGLCGVSLHCWHQPWDWLTPLFVCSCVDWLWGRFKHEVSLHTLAPLLPRFKTKSLQRWQIKYLSGKQNKFFLYWG